MLHWKWLKAITVSYGHLIDFLEKYGKYVGGIPENKGSDCKVLCISPMFTVHKQAMSPS